MKLRPEIIHIPKKFGFEECKMALSDEVESSELITRSLECNVSSEKSVDVANNDEGVSTSDGSCEEETACDGSPQGGSDDAHANGKDVGVDIVARIVALSSSRSCLPDEDDVIALRGEHSWERWSERDVDSDDMTSTPPTSNMAVTNRPAVVDSNPDAPTSILPGDDLLEPPSSPTKKVKPILKKRTCDTDKRTGRKITFNDMLTVFSDSFGTSLVAMRSDMTLPEDIYVAYEPPPEYQDCVDFEPPEEYKDQRFETVLEEPEVNFEDVSDPLCCETSDETIIDQNVPKPSQDSFEISQVDSDSPNSNSNRLLTKENLKQHEEWMKGEKVTLEGSFVIMAESPSTSRPDDDSSNPSKNLSFNLPKEYISSCEELSPLSSGNTQETESDSSLSSQDTIIMMTSDESKRNEEHIKQNLKVYKGLKKTDNSSFSSSESDETKSSGEAPSSDSQVSSGSSTLDGWTSDDIRRVIERNAMRRSLQRYTEARKRQPNDKRSSKEMGQQQSLSERIKQLTCVDNESVDSGVDSERSNSDSSSSSSSSSSTTFEKRYQIPAPMLIRDGYNGRARTVVERTGSSPGDLTCRQRHSLAYHGYISPLGNVPSTSRYSNHSAIHRSSSDLNVPTSSDIRYQPRTSAAGEESFYDKSICDNSTINELGVESSRLNSRLAEGGVDELELFVKQDSDRIDRIRFRYSYSSGADSSLEFSPEMLVRKPSVRGIKTKFGSTNEILHQMQTQIQPPLYASPKSIGSHMTWPYSPDVTNRNTQLPSSQSSFVLKNVHHEEPTVSRPAEIGQQMRVHRGNVKLSANKDERGAPEGASSSPKVSSDPLCPSLQIETQHGSDGVIFYSMNV